MITDVLTYVLHIAPSLGVVLLLVVLMNDRLARNEKRVQEALEICMMRVLDHMDRHDQQP